MKTENILPAALEDKSDIKPVWVTLIDISPYLAGIIIALILSWFDFI